MRPSIMYYMYVALQVLTSKYLFGAASAAATVIVGAEVNAASKVKAYMPISRGG